MKLSEIYIRDPFILPYNGMYYLYGKRRESDLKFCVYKSIDLENWSEPEVIFAPSENFWATKDFWAPEVHAHNGKFYLFASFKSEDRMRGTQILVSDKPDGMFQPVSNYAQTPENWECLDGTLYVDKKGNPYMVFCHEWTQIGNGTVCSARLSEDFSKFETEPQVLFAAADYEFVSAYHGGNGGYVTDGPFFYRTINDELLLTWSSFGERGYFVSVLKSDNGEIDGNWIAQSLLFEEDGGHGMLFKTFEGELRFVFHTPNGPAGLERAVIYKIKEKDGSIVLENR